MSDLAGLDQGIRLMFKALRCVYVAQIDSMLAAAQEDAIGAYDGFSVACLVFQEAHGRFPPEVMDKSWCSCIETN